MGSRVGNPTFPYTGVRAVIALSQSRVQQASKNALSFMRKLPGHIQDGINGWNYFTGDLRSERPNNSSFFIRAEDDDEVRADYPGLYSALKLVIDLIGNEG